jgi:hypothetical protein
MFVAALPSPGRAVLAGVALIALSTTSLPPGAAGAEKRIQVDWSSPEIATFVKEQAANPARSLGPTADDKLSKLELPVLGFSATPGVVEGTFRLGPKPAAERDVVVDEKEPIWYQIVERYGDVTVSVEADLRVQHQFPDSYALYGSARQGAAPQAGPEISVFDEQNESGEEALVAEYTVYKFGVPYTVTVECSAEAKDQCRNTGQIAKDSELLTILRANPPPQ